MNFSLPLSNETESNLSEKISIPTNISVGDEPVAKGY